MGTIINSSASDNLFNHRNDNRIESSDQHLRAVSLYVYTYVFMYYRNQLHTLFLIDIR